MHTRAMVLFSQAMQRLRPESEQYVPDIVRLILEHARQGRASDVHLVPTEQGLQMLWRIDSVLQTVAIFDGELSPRIIARLKVLCGLLTYRTDVPQEGRVSREHSESEVRVTTFPTLYGEKAAIRLFAESACLQQLEQLGLPTDIEHQLREQLTATDGVILLTGPSGSGKTTTVYACLRAIAAASGESRSVMTLEDPIEVAVDGVTQSQVRPASGFDLTAGLKSLMRQDPDVIMVGEIRDPETAEAVFQAALTGHLVLTTFHAGSCVEALTRLLELGIEPYLIRSALRTIVCQRLLRRIKADDLSRSSDEMGTKQISDALPLTGSGRENPGIARESDGILHKSASVSHPMVSCVSDAIHQTSVSANRGVTSVSKNGNDFEYRGRMVLAEMLDPGVPRIAQSILNRADARQMAMVAADSGFRSLRDSAQEAVAAGLTTSEEVFRVLGRHSQNDAHVRNSDGG